MTEYNGVKVEMRVTPFYCSVFERIFVNIVGKEIIRFLVKSGGFMRFANQNKNINKR